MSADNWTWCPRCRKRERAALEERAREVDASYGVVSVAEFDAARAKLLADTNEYNDGQRRTWREDYEFFGADEGVVNVSYKGSCTECGLFIEIIQKYPILGVDDPPSPIVVRARRRPYRTG